MSAHLFHLPRVKPLAPRKSAYVSVLDIGTTKIACLIAKLIPMEPSKALFGRTHAIKILGLGYARARGIKAGQVMDVVGAEQCIRHAVHAAERMAGMTIARVLVSVSCGRLYGFQAVGKTVMHARAVERGDCDMALDDATAPAFADTARCVLHALPMRFTLDAMHGIVEPCGMIGSCLGAEATLVTAEPASLRNLVLTVERCHLAVEGVVATPYASALATLVDDEAELGTAVIDCGGGATTLAVFEGGGLLHVDALAVGGHHITMDVARGLMVSVPDAERAKMLFGAAVLSVADERETIPVSHVGEEHGLPHYVPRAQLIRIIRPRLEETFELIQARLRDAGFYEKSIRRVVLTGGASLLGGLGDLAKSILGRPVRLGRPVGVRGLPEGGKSPAFATAVGLLCYPQLAYRDYHPTARFMPSLGLAHNGYLARVGRWLQDSF